jgi:3-methyladenine DNA glycosylase/8-oxoguanine DNA glycosylase
MSDRSRRVTLDGPVDLPGTLRSLAVTATDPCVRAGGRDAWIGAATPDGPAGLHLRADGDAVTGTAWGPGAGWMLEHLPGLVGAHDRPEGLRPVHPIVAEAVRRRPGVRVPRTGRLLDLAVGTVFAQKVTGVEAGRAWRAIVRRCGAPAPGVPGLAVPPPAEAIASLGYADFHAFGVERRRAETVLRLARVAPRLEAAVAAVLGDGTGTTDAAALDVVQRRLAAIPGVGPWTIGILRYGVLGDADAVPVGDFHVPNTVAWALAGEPRADDARMLELLTPYAGHRGRVVQLLELTSGPAPKYGPRTPVRSIIRM